MNAQDLHPVNQSQNIEAAGKAYSNFTEGENEGIEISLYVRHSEIAGLAQSLIDGDIEFLFHYPGESAGFPTSGPIQHVGKIDSEQSARDAMRELIQLEFDLLSEAEDA